MVHLVADKEDFDSNLEEAGDKLVVVDFFATWCGPCKMISPFIDKLELQFKDVVVFLKVDIDECEDLAQEYDINCMPTFIFIKKKEKVEEFAGANQDKLKELIDKMK